MQEDRPAHSDSSSDRSGGNWKWLALGCGGCLGVTVMGLGLLIYLASRALQISTSPAQVESQAQTLFTYQLPGGSQGVVELNLLGLTLIQVTNNQSPPTVQLTLGHIPAMLQQQTSQPPFLESLQQELALDQGYQLLEQRREDRTLCGQTISLLIQSATYQAVDPPAQAISYLAVVNHQGRDQFAWILTQGDTAQQMAEQVFGSLTCP